MSNQVKIELLSESNTIEDFNAFIKEENLRGIITTIEKAPQKEGTLSVESYLPVIKVVLSSTVAVAGVKGLFDIIKKWFDLKALRETNMLESEKIKAEERKIALTRENENGKLETLELSIFTKKERQQFIDYFKK